MKDNVLVVIDGIKTRVPIDDIENVTAASVNDAFRKAGIDVTKVAAVTPAQELLNKLQQLEYQTKQLIDSEKRNKEWQRWFDDLRMNTDGVKRNDKEITWNQLECEQPHPTLEDERVEAMMDE